MDKMEIEIKNIKIGEKKIEMKKNKETAILKL